MRTVKPSNIARTNAQGRINHAQLINFPNVFASPGEESGGVHTVPEADPKTQKQQYQNHHTNLKDQSKTFPLQNHLLVMRN